MGIDRAEEFDFFEFVDLIFDKGENFNIIKFLDIHIYINFLFRSRDKKKKERKKKTRRKVVGAFFILWFQKRDSCFPSKFTDMLTHSKCLRFVYLPTR